VFAGVTERRVKTPLQVKLAHQGSIDPPTLGDLHQPENEYESRISPSLSDELPPTTRLQLPRGGPAGECFQCPRCRPVSAIEVVQDSCVADGRPGLRMATPAFNRVWRMVSGLTCSSLAIEAQERPKG